MKESLWTKKIKKIALENSEGFIKNLLSNMKVKVSSKIPTICVKEDSIIVNPYFCSRLEKESIVAVINHEIKHVVFNSVRNMGVKPQEKIEILSKINLL